MKNLLLAAFGFLLAPGALNAQAIVAVPASEEKQTGYTKVVSNFFDALKSAKFNQAAHILIDTNKRDQFDVQKHEGLSVPLQKLSSSIGPLKEFEPVISKSVGDGGVIGYEYGVAIYDKGFVRFEFYFVRDNDGWHMLQLDFKDNFTSEIRNLAGVHFQESPSLPDSPSAKPGSAR